MLIRETEDYQNSLIKIGRYLKEVDKEQGTVLFYEFPVHLDKAIAHISKWPNSTPKYKNYQSRRVSLEKFPSYYLIYYYDDFKDILTLLEVRSYKQNSK